MSVIYTFLTVIVLNLFAVTEIPYTALETAFAKGDAGKIVSYGKDKMIVNVLEKEGVYSQSQASQILKDFFVKNPSATFKFSFKGKESDEGAYSIGSYTSKDETYRVTVKWKKISSDFKIESISIEKS